MDSSLVIELVLMALRMAVVLAGPTLLTVLVIGILLGAIQSATQINEPSMVFVPKMLAVMFVIGITGPATLGMFVDYVREMITRIPAIAG